jgi:hypothetical protein
MDEVVQTFGRWYIASLNNFLKQTNEKVVRVLKSHGLYARGIIDERIANDLMGKVSFVNNKHVNKGFTLIPKKNENY